jgi:hypothetical protein
MNESRRLSSLTEDSKGFTQDLSMATDSQSGTTRPFHGVTQSLPPPTTRPQHAHHRITSFDINDYASLSSREIKERNKNTMSILSSLTTATPRRAMSRRKEINLQMAHPEDVESKQHELEIRPKHIIKIFTGDRDVTEVTPRQVARIKKMHESIEDSVNF